MAFPEIENQYVVDDVDIVADRQKNECVGNTVVTFGI